MLKLQVELVDGTIPVSEMKDGDIGVIIYWSTSRYIGRIVQRYCDCLLTVGAESGCGWGEYFKSPYVNSGCRVRILEKSETLVVE